MAFQATWPFHHPSHSYDPIGFDPATNNYEMSDMGFLSPPPGETDAASSTSGTAPLLASSKREYAGATSEKSPTRKIEKRGKNLHGWRMGVSLCAATAGSVLTVNFILAIWASTKFGVDGGIGTVQEGSCARTKNLSLWLHLAINVLSTLLLGASNYCMQCLTSPTREEVDRAHSRHIWLDIGIPSVRNLRRVSWYKIILWWLLAISGIPLHLLYNSAVFSTLSTPEYSVFIGAPDLVSGVGINYSAPIEGYTTSPNTTLNYLKNVSTWSKLANEECITAYGQAFVSNRGDVLAVSSGLNTSKPIMWLGYSSLGGGMGGNPASEAYSWICAGASYSEYCDANEVVKKAASWQLSAGASDVRFSTFSIEYCLSQPIREHCRLQFSLAIVIVVICANLIKTVCMLLVLWRQRSHPLVTLGDAIESFLVNPDPTTERMCLAGKESFVKGEWKETAIAWYPKRYRWFSSASLRRWLTCNSLCISTLITVSVLLGLGLNNTALTSKSLSHLTSLGFGQISAEQLISWEFAGSGGLLITVLIANSPQALLSFLFLTYNGLFTCMLLADEWSGYFKDRKPLRVTSPDGTQRSTYRLQLPYKYGIPLMTLSGTLHWLVSQSIFLARVSEYDQAGVVVPGGEISTVGYSCIAIITVIIVGSLVVILGIVNGFRRYKPGMPLAGSCSAAISAACHRPKKDFEAATLGVKWGVPSDEDGDGVGRCCFTSFEVTTPEMGRFYAG